MESNAHPQAETKTTPQVVKVKYNHEEKEMPVEDVVVLAQKGMNYDKVYTKAQELESKLQGYEAQIGEYRTKEEQRKAEDQVKQLVGDGIDETVAKQLVEAQAKATITEQELTQLKAKAAVENQINVFKAERPDVNLEAIPDEVIEAAKKSGNLLKEFNAWESGALRAKLAELEKQLGTKQANDENAAASMGSAETKGSSALVKIDEKTIARMSPEELKTNHKSIWEYLTKKG